MRRVFLLLLSTVAFVTVAVLLSPYWLQVVLPAVARSFHATYSSYSRVGYSRFVLENVTVERRTVTIRVARAEADTPWLWGLRHLLHRDRVILADDWEVKVHHNSNHGPDTEESGWRPLQSHLSRIADGLERWLRFASIGHGHVDWPKNDIAVEHAVWNQRKIQVEQFQWNGWRADVALVFDRGSEYWELTAQNPKLGLSLTAKNEDARLQGHLTFDQQSAPFSMDFGSAGWLPDEAKIAVENWKLAASTVQLKNYAEIAGTVRASWSHEQFHVLANVMGQPNAGSALPPLKVAIHADGDYDHYAIDQIDVDAVGFQAHLNRPLTGAFPAANFASATASQFKVDGQLSAIPGLKAEGEIHGILDVQPRGAGWPKFEFQGNGERLALGLFKVAQLNFAGEFDWPLLKIDHVNFADSAASQLRITGRADLAKKELADFRADGHVNMALFRPWLPPGVSFSDAQVALVANGPFAHLSHEGTVNIDQLKVHQISPATAKIWWRGEGAHLPESTLGIQIGTTEVIASGGVDLSGVRLDKLVWRHAGQDRLALQSRAQIRWKPGLQVENFDLHGPAGELSLSGEWGEQGTVNFFARGIESAWWHDLVPFTPFDWSIEKLSIQANWSKGPVNVSTSGVVRLEIPERDPITIDLEAKAENHVVTVETLRATELQTVLANFSGKLPIELFAGFQPHFAIDRGAPVAVQGRLNPNAPEWTELAKRLGLLLKTPDLALALTGTLDQPRGTLNFAAAELQLDSRFGQRKWPKIENLHAELRASGDRLELTSAGMNIAGQPVALSGSLPTGPGTWRKLLTSPGMVLRDEAELSLKIDHADLSGLTSLISPSLLPQGHLDVDVALSSSGPWKGFIRFNDLATKPIGSLGRLRDIHAALSLDGRKIAFDDFEASFGERPIKISGTVVLLPDQAPKIDLDATGDDLPFVREAGLLLRGNIKLKLTSASKNGLQPLVHGEVELTDGLFVSDVRSLIPRGGSSPSLRPPYFSIEEDPFRNWRLDVDVHGERFLRARTTVFTGVTSMKFHLLGTLGEPHALGELRLSEGQVIFPFAQFALNDATVRLTEGNPYDPTLGIFGTSRRYGYDVSMEVTGEASAPVIVFSSNPPLTSEQVLLMVMAGEVPKDEITYSTSQRLSRLGTFFGQSLLGSLSGGRGQDRITITTGEEVSITGRETYDVEYALDDRWSLVGEYDQFDDYNAGVKWRIMPKNKRRADDKK